MHVIDIPKGNAPNVDRLLEVRGANEGTLRCRVRRSSNKSLLELSIEDGNVFVMSAVRQKKGWVISEVIGGSTSDKDCVARVLPNEDGSFTCVRGDVAGSELLHVRHSDHTVNGADDMPSINTMLVAQSVNADAPAGVLARSAQERPGQEAAQTAVLQSKLPKLDAKTGAFVLPYAGRAKLASARNFQLTRRGGAARQIVLLYGKLEQDEFALDFAHPLSMLQAFAIVLTTWGW